MIYRISPQVFSRSIRGLQTIYNLSTGEYHSCNELGSCVLQLLISGATAAELLSTILEEYSVSEAEAIRDIESLLASFLEMGLIQSNADSIPGAAQDTFQLSNNLFEQESVDIYRQNLAKDNFIKIPEFLNEKMLSWLQEQVREAAFRPKSHQHGAYAVEDLMIENPLYDVLYLLLNSDEMIQWAREVTGNKKIESFLGRGYRLRPGTDQYFDWHTDAARGRTLAFSLNMETAPYIGGDLKIRALGQPETVRVVTNHRYNSAVLFNVHDALEHKVTPVQSGHKLAFAGWFTVQADFKPEYVWEEAGSSATQHRTEQFEKNSL